MEIKKGEFYKNRTKQYLLPAIVTELGAVFKQKFNTEIYKVAVGIRDVLLDGTNILKGKKAIFILVDKTILNSEFQKFKNWVKYKDYYITDYQYSEYYHMFVLEIPEKLNDAYDKFKKGEYSKMYNNIQLEKYYPNKGNTYKTLTKHPSIRKKFIETVKKEFDVEIFESDFIDAELDYPPKIEEYKEIFNYE